MFIFYINPFLINRESSQNNNNNNNNNNNDNVSGVFGLDFNLRATKGCEACFLELNTIFDFYLISILYLKSKTFVSS